MIFFFDTNLSDKLAKAMGYLDDECQVVHLRDNFNPDERDEIWLQYVGNNEMILITRDKKICKHPAEIAAFRQYNIGAFFLIGKKYTRWQEIKQIILAWEEIKKMTLRTRRPFAFQVSLHGKIKPYNL